MPFRVQEAFVHMTLVVDKFVNAILIDRLLVPFRVQIAAHRNLYIQLVRSGKEDFGIWKYGLSTYDQVSTITVFFYFQHAAEEKTQKRIMSFWMQVAILPASPARRVYLFEAVELQFDLSRKNFHSHSRVFPIRSSAHSCFRSYVPIFS